MGLGPQDTGTLVLALLDLPHWPRRARGLGRWAIREFAAGRTQRWLSEHISDYAWPAAFAHLLGLTAGVLGRLAERHEPLPHYRTMAWDDLMEWVAEKLSQLEDESVQGWERRDVVHSFPNGWTIVRVSTASDIEREGRLMGNCRVSEARGLRGCFAARSSEPATHQRGD